MRLYHVVLVNTYRDFARVFEQEGMALTAEERAIHRQRLKKLVDDGLISDEELQFIMAQLSGKQTKQPCKNKH